MRAVRPNSVTIATTVSLHAVAHGFLDCGDGVVERAEQRRQLPASGAFVDVRIPAHEARGTHARTIGLRQIFRRRAGGIGGVFTHASHVGWHRSACALRRVHRAVARQGHQVTTPLERASKLGVGMAIKLQQAHLGVVARREGVAAAPTT